MYDLSRVGSRYTHSLFRAPRPAKTFDGRVSRLTSLRYLIKVAEAVAAGGTVKMKPGQQS